MSRIFLALTFVIIATPALADAINVGQAFGFLEPYINTLVGGLLSILIGWVLYLVKSKLNISVDDSMRDALQTWAKRQASSLVADGLVKVEGLKVNVSNAALANVANLAIAEIPDAVNRFGLTPDKLSGMVLDHIPHVPSVAAVAAAQAKPAA